MASCSAVIDPIPAGAVLPEAARIRPLPLPALARERRGRETVVVRSDGSAADGNGDARPAPGGTGQRVPVDAAA
jgi:hypothetical protein